MPLASMDESLGGGPFEIIEDSEDKIVVRIHKCSLGFGFSEIDEKLCEIAAIRLSRLMAEMRC